MTECEADCEALKRELERERLAHLKLAQSTSAESLAKLQADNLRLSAQAQAMRGEAQNILDWQRRGAVRDSLVPQPWGAPTVWEKLEAAISSDAHRPFLEELERLKAERDELREKLEQARKNFEVAEQAWIERDEAIARAERAEGRMASVLEALRLPMDSDREARVVAELVERAEKAEAELERERNAYKTMHDNAGEIMASLAVERDALRAELEQWRAKSREQGQKLAIAGVEGSPPPGETTIGRLTRENRELRADLAKAEGHILKLTDKMDRAGGDAYGMPECPWCSRQGYLDEPSVPQEHDADCELALARAFLSRHDARQAQREAEPLSEFLQKLPRSNMELSAQDIRDMAAQIAKPADPCQECGGGGWIYAKPLSNGSCTNTAWRCPRCSPNGGGR